MAPALVLCALLALLSEGPAGQPAPGPAAVRAGGPPSQGGTYRRPLENDPVTLDPAFVSDIYAFTVLQQIFDGLVQYDESAGIRPCLAQSWKSSRDGLTWTFQLRRGVRFHHGREMTADDVIYSLTRLLDPRRHVRVGVADFFLKIRGAKEFAGGKAVRIEGLRALDPYTLEVVLTEPSAQFLASLGVANTKIVPREIVERLGERFGVEPVGTGPFRFVEWQRSQRLVLAANPDYFGGRPHVDRVEYRVFPGLATDRILASFERGELEDSPIPAGERRRFLDRGPYQLVQRPILGVAFLAFNTAVRPFDDARVRQAIAYAIDRTEIARTINQARFIPGSGILPPGTYGYDPTFRALPYDPARARTLLAEAGFPEGRGIPPIQLWSNRKSPEALAEHEAIARYLAAVGVKVQSHYNTNWPDFNAAVYGGKYPMFRYSWYADTPDPHSFLYLLFHSASPNNLARYRDPQVNALLLKAEGELDYMKRAALYRQAERQIAEQAPIIVLYFSTYERVFQAYVRGVQVSALGDPYVPMRSVWLDRGVGPAALRAARP